MHRDPARHVPRRAHDAHVGQENYRELGAYQAKQEQERHHQRHFDGRLPRLGYSSASARHSSITDALDVFEPVGKSTRKEPMLTVVGKKIMLD